MLLPENCSYINICLCMLSFLNVIDFLLEWLDLAAGNNILLTTMEGQVTGYTHVGCRNKDPICLSKKKYTYANLWWKGLRVMLMIFVVHRWHYIGTSIAWLSQLCLPQYQYHAQILIHNWKLYYRLFCIKIQKFACSNWKTSHALWVLSICCLI